MRFVDYIRTPELAIDKTGIRGLDRRQNSRRRDKHRSIWTTLGWDEVHYCCWGRSSPGLLNIQAPDERYFVKIPEHSRAKIEKTLRAFGKWRE